jgi:hypothetical protein
LPFFAVVFCCVFVAVLVQGCLDCPEQGEQESNTKKNKRNKNNTKKNKRNEKQHKEKQTNQKKH